MALNIFEKRIKAWNEKYPPLSPEILRKINKLVEQYDKTQQVEKDSKVLSITDGTKLVREFKGRRYTVLVLQDGYEFNGSKYKSLSAVANKITGTRWNGKKFFGLIDPKCNKNKAALNRQNCTSPNNSEVA